MRIYRLLIITLLFFQIHAIAQKKVFGKVTDTDNNPLIGAAVYLNNTSIGTTTDDEGEFELVVKNGTYNLIISYLGYETLQYALTEENKNKRLIFKMTPKNNVLDEIVISNKKMSKEDRAYFMGKFRRSFLGKTKMASECKILNEEVIDFSWDNASATLKADISAPIKIEHKGLGYLITYDLVHFQLDRQRITYLGYTRYEELKGSKRKQKIWKKQREVAYNGSTMHFFRSIINDEIDEEGFIVDHFKRVPNPARPHDSIINKARQALMNFSIAGQSQPFKLFSSNDLNIKANRDKLIDEMKGKSALYKTNLDARKLKSASYDVIKRDDGTYEARTKVKTNRAKDSLIQILKKSRLRRFVDQDIRQNLTIADFTSKNNGVNYLEFPFLLKVKYMNEKEEDRYRPGPARLDYQVSIISLYVKSTPIDKTGVLVKPLDMFMDGYWGYEKIADALPLDYLPK